MPYKLTQFQKREDKSEKTKEAKHKILETLKILEELGIPFEDLYSPRQNRRVERLCLTLLALCDVKPFTPWSQAKSRNDQINLKTREILDYWNTYYGENMARGSYDDVKRKDIDTLLVSGIVISGCVETTATNDSRSGYAISPEYVQVIRKFGTNEWNEAVKNILTSNKTLKQKIDTDRNLTLIPVTLPNGVSLKLSKGKHNKLQKAIIEDFFPRYGHGCEILYIGDSTSKYLHCETAKLLELNFPEPSHRELPDIIAFSKDKGWVYLVESVTSFGEISSIRKLELEELTQGCHWPVIYVTAFPDRETYRKFCANLAWETEVWISSAPDHLIHLNGDKFLGPHQVNKLSE